MTKIETSSFDAALMNTARLIEARTSLKGVLRDNYQETTETFRTVLSEVMKTQRFDNPLNALLWVVRDIGADWKNLTPATRLCFFSAAADLCEATT